MEGPSIYHSKEKMASTVNAELFHFPSKGKIYFSGKWEEFTAEKRLLKINQI
jgi:hypothetical protein